MKSLLSLTLWAATAVARTGLLIPFYEYPNDASKGDWDSLIAAVDAYPNLDFYVIIDNQSGAPYEGANPPDSIKDWAQRLGQLNDPKRTNSHPIGYVYTTQSARTYADITRGVDQYANWTKATGWDGADHDIHVEGIFFDEVDTTKLQETKTFATYAKSLFQGRGGPVVLNPGGLVPAGSESLFDIADSVVQMETCYTTAEGATNPDGKPRCPKGRYVPFTKASLDTLGSNAANIAKSSVLVHDFYDSWNPYQPAPLSTLEEDVKAIVNKGVHSFYIAQQEWQGGFMSEPASISNVARLAAAAQDL